MTVRDELLTIKGRLHAISPDDVVEWAKAHKRSHLYAAFEANGLWDDATAADIARREFGRGLIQRYRINVTAATGGTYRVRAMVSLTEERQPNGRSYRSRQSVLNNEQRMAKLRRDFQRDVDSLVRRYADILTRSEIDSLYSIGAAVANESSGGGRTPRTAARSE